jgi:hypothetical protein
MFARRLFWVLSAIFAVGAVFFLFLERSHLEAEHLNLVTLVGRDNPDPQIDLLIVGIALGLAAIVRSVKRDFL